MADNEIKVTLTLEDRQAERSLKSFRSQLDKTAREGEKAFSRMDVAVAAFGANLASAAVQKGISFLVNGLSDFAGGAIEASRSAEVIKTQLETLTGSATEAANVFQGLVEFTASTPFRLEGVAEAANQLIAFGFEADTVQERLRNIGDVAAGSNSDLKEVALIYGQVAAAGKLTGERLLQLQERAVPIGSALASTLGVAESSVRDLVSSGKVGFAEFEEAFNSLSESGGLFEGAIQKQSQTLSGALSTLQDNFRLVQQAIGDAFSPAFVVVAQAISQAINQTVLASDGLKESLQSFAQDTVEFVADAVIALVQAFNLIPNAADGIIIALQATIEGITNLAAAALEAKAQVSEFFGGSGDAARKAAAELRAFGEEQANIGVEAAKAIEERSQAELELEQTIQGVRDRAIQASVAEKEQIEADTQFKKQKNQELVESEQQKIDAIAFLKQEEKLKEEEARLTANLLRDEQNQQELALLQENLAAQSALKEQASKQDIEVAKKIGAARTAESKKASDAQKNSLSSLFSFEQNTNAGRAANFKSTLGTISTLQRSSNKQLFAVGKAAAIGQATIDGFAAVQKALASAPPPFNFVLAGIVGAATAANVASIASQQPPAFQNGGIVGGTSFTGDNVQARVNSGEMILNRQQQAQLFAQANGNNSSSNGSVIDAINRLTDAVNNQPVMVSIDGRNVAEAVRDQVDGGFVLA